MTAKTEQQQGREGELLPCPHCGMIAQQIGPAQYRLWHADDCKLSPCNPDWFKTQREIDNWNRRVTAPAGEGEKIYWPAQCSCGHLYLEKYQFNEPNKDGEIGFCWCGFCKTKRMIKPTAPTEKGAGE